MHLLEVYDLPVVDSPQSGSGIPSNTDTGLAFDSNIFTITVLTVLLIIFVIVSIVLIYKYIKNKNAFKFVLTHEINNLTENEKQFLEKYKKLTEAEKEIVNNTLNSLNTNDTNHIG